MVTRILLLIEDYSELSHFETHLRKIGFDVMGAHQEIQLQQQILSFNPEILVAMGKGQKISPLRIGRKLKEFPRLTSKVILSLDKASVQATDLMHARVDLILEYPCTFEKLLNGIAKVQGVDPQVYLSKFLKLKATVSKDVPSSAVHVTGDVSEAPTQYKVDGKISSLASARSHRFREALANLPSVDTKKTFSHQAVKSTQEQLKEGWDIQLLKELDRQKRQFVDALFNKKKS